MAKLDQYGLPGAFLVRLNEDSMGNMTLKPIVRKWRARVAKSNDYDGHGTVFAQEANWKDWTDTLPKSAFYGRGSNRGFNDGAVFIMGSWEFRHLVGGQSD